MNLIPRLQEWACAQTVMVETGNPNLTCGERAQHEQDIQATMETVLEMQLDALRRRLYG